MTRLLVILLAILFGFFVHASDLQVELVDQHEKLGRSQLTVFSAPTETLDFSVSDADRRVTQPITAKPRAIDLWVLVDTSALCELQKVDSYANRLIQNVKNQFNADSKLTVVTYSNESLDTVTRRKSLSDVEGIKLECGGRTHASSFERPLNRLLSELKATDLPTVVWVLSSGTIELSKKSLRTLESRDAELHVVLYNPFVEKEVRPIWEQIQNALAQNRTSFSLMEKAVRLPSTYFDGEFAVPSAWRGTTTVLEFAATAKGAKTPAATQEVTSNFPQGGWLGFWKRYGRWIALSLVLSGVGYGIYRVIAYYRVRHCRQCKRPLSFHHSTCLFCENPAYLVGNFRRRADGFGQAGDRPSVLALVRKQTDIGASRRSPVRMPRGPGRTKLVSFIREQRPTGETSYRLERSSLIGGKVDVRVNGHFVETERYLKNGDQIIVDSTQFTFVCEGGTRV